MRKNRLLDNRRGVSTLFIAIYLMIIAIILMTTIFVGMSFSNARLTDYQRAQQERNQEKILLNTIEINQETNRIESVLVENTGAITVRIRSIYIGRTYVCDPSTFSGDSFIPSQSSLSIDLLNHIIYANTTTLSGNWTVTTERGTATSETGANLWLGSSQQMNDPGKIYYGPICLYFNSFQWSNDNGNSWHVGWRIPEAPGDVIWRVDISNIDNRPIILSTKCNFALIQNSQQSNKIATWDIGPTNLNPAGLRLEPKLIYALHFSLNGPNSLNYMSTPIPIASNFLTIIGDFVQEDGSLKGFAQTIPFQAVLITDEQEIATKTTLNSISSPQTCMQSVSVSGTVTPVNTLDPQVPRNSYVMIQYSSPGTEDWVNIYPQIKTSNNGVYSGSFLPPHAGTYNFRALFIGAEGSQYTWGPSNSSSQTIVINKAPSTIALNVVSPITIGQSTTVTATVNPSFATGTVNFEFSTDSGTTYGLLGTSSLTSGTTSLVYTPPTPGTNYRFRATYTGDADVLASPVSQVRSLTVNKATPSISTPTLNPPSPITIGESVTASVTFTGVTGITPTGDVVFQYSTNGGTTWNTLCNKPCIQGLITSDPYIPHTIGTSYRIRVTYPGDINYNSATSGIASLTVKAISSVSQPTLTPNSPITYGTSVTVSATVSGSYGTPTGTMTFQVSTDGGASFIDFSTKTLTSGSATSDAYLPRTAGLNYQFRAVYSGDSSYWSSTSSTSPLVVNKATTTTTLSFPTSMPANEPLIVTASITPNTATGVVAFEFSTDGTNYTPFGAVATVNSGIANSNPITLPTSTESYTFRATYSGDTNFLSSSTPVPLTLHLVTFTQTGVGTDFTGTMLSLNSANYGRDGYSAWFQAGSSVHYSYQTPLNVGSDKRYVKTSTEATPLMVTSPIDITANYQTQFYLTVDSGGHGTPGSAGWYNAGSTAQATITPLIVDGGVGIRYLFAGWSGDAYGTSSPSNNILMDTGKTATATWTTEYYLTVSTNFGTVSPISGWFAAGSVVTISATAPSAGAGERYVWNGWTGSGSGSYTGTDNPASNAVSMYGPITEAASWIHEYYLIVNNGGYGTADGSGWYVAGSTQPFSISPTAVPGASGVQYVFSAWSGDSTSTAAGDTITMNSARTVTATWTTQYYLTMNTNFGTTNTVSGWYNAGSIVSISATAPSVGPDEQYIWNGWTGIGIGSYTGNEATPSITMNEPTTETASWVHQWFITVNSNGYGNPTQISQWVNDGDSFSVSVTSPEGDASHRFIVIGSDTQSITFVHASQTLTFEWQEQFYLTVNNGGHGTAGGSGWYNVGSYAQATITPLTIDEGGTVYNFAGWSGDASGTNSPSNPILMNGPKTATATWTT